MNDRSEGKGWQSRAESDIGVSLQQLQPLGGGDFAQSFRATIGKVSGSVACELSVGDTIFIKTHSNPPPNHFSTEARGLQWLAETQSVNVPTVLGCSDEKPYLALGWVTESSSHSNDTEAEFGRQLAAMHRADCDGFGRSDKRSTGSLGLPNAPCKTWADFFATQRLLPLKKIAAEKGALSTKTLDRIEKLSSELGNHGPTLAAASRLHGDLWAGNRMVDGQGKSWVIDPASHGGHREFDLAMMRLFGGFGQQCHDAYQEAYPLEAGWQERIGLHQLAPLIVHAIKFGHAYIAPTEEALARY